MKTGLLVTFLLGAFSFCHAGSRDQVRDFAMSRDASDRVIAALGLPDWLRVSGVDRVAPFYARLLADSDKDVVTETLSAIKRTPPTVTINGKRQSTRPIFDAVLPRVRELCASPDLITRQTAREARLAIRSAISHQNNQ